MTGRPRRCGWLDLPLLRYSNMINGTEWLVVTKLDVLDGMAEIPVCTGYEIDGKKVDTDAGGRARAGVDQAGVHEAEGLEASRRRMSRIRTSCRRRRRSICGFWSRSRARRSGWFRRVRTGSRRWRCRSLRRR